jgi:arginyl-tRNA synthetase
VTPIGELRGAVEAAAASLGASGTAPTLERPKRDAFGDYSTNAAMLLAPTLRDQPRVIAERLGAELEGRLGAGLAHWEVAGPGFLNLTLTDAWYAAALAGIERAGPGFGGGEAAAPEHILVEFVSANPTGPLTAASGRHAAYGDALARILEFAGNTVQREYYVNDHGTQVARLGESIRARARGEDVPEGGYEGEYVADLAAALPDAATAPVEELARAGVAANVERIRATLTAFGVAFDIFFYESSLYDGEHAALFGETMRALEASGQVYESEGAIWLRTSALGDDKDRVLRRTDGAPTYFLPDAAHHLWKLRSGNTRWIDIFGADHHGYVARMQAAVTALGAHPGALEILIMQFVHIVEGGSRASMSKRRGEFITLDELLGEIGVDAARWFLLARSHDTTLDLDLDLARSESAENPVYYVQYAHARIASVLRKAGADRVAAALAAAGSEPGAELHPAERSLVKKLAAYPEEIAEAVARRAPHRMAAYALELAQEFTAFYRDCRVVGAEPAALEDFRIALCSVAKRTIASALLLLGVSAPEEM